MNERASYRAVVFGPNPIAAGTEMDLPYVDGEYQDELIIDDVEDGETIRRRYRRGHETAEPIPYRFVEEDNTGEAKVPN